MAEEKSPREMIYETNRDVKWICRVLKEMKETDSSLELRVRDLERWRDGREGEERKARRIGMTAGGTLGGFAALIIELFLRG
ncbi:MAG TPA: hypothetical protein VE134_04150 [Methanomicrobiales archaeon]|nr:hypothetical protein [Methanomicrobiales archaeon]